MRFTADTLQSEGLARNYEIFPRPVRENVSFEAVRGGFQLACELVLVRPIPPGCAATLARIGQASALED